MADVLKRKARRAKKTEGIQVPEDVGNNSEAPTPDRFLYLDKLDESPNTAADPPDRGAQKGFSLAEAQVLDALTEMQNL
ncbi:MAG: hypothetical protein Q9218_004839 [Villophora microphyllina]